MDPIRQIAAATPRKPALIDHEATMSWGAFAAARDKVAAALHANGVRAGDHAIIYLANSNVFQLALSVLTYLGVVAIPMNHRLTPGEAQYIVEHSDAKVVIVDDTFVAVAERIRADCPKVALWLVVGERRQGWAAAWDDLIATSGAGSAPAGVAPKTMLYTGGTTGRPKGAVRSKQNAQQLLTVARELGLDRPDHVHLVAGPLYHAGPLAFASLTLMFGGTNVIMPKFDEHKAWSLMIEHSCTTAFMAPTLLKRFVDVAPEFRAGCDLSALKCVIVSGAPCPMSVKQKALSVLGPVIYEFYGATETALCTLLRPEEILSHPGSCGRAAPGVLLKVRGENGEDLAPGEVGELFMHASAGAFDGYYKDEDATRETIRGDWVSVGDLAMIDEDGFVYIRDRMRDMIISGGVNIYSVEIENALHRHSKLADVAVFGVPDEEWGERVHAAVELKPGETVDAGELQSFVRDHLAGYKVPREISFHDSLPRDQAGKLQKRLLRDQFWKGVGRSV